MKVPANTHALEINNVSVRIGGVSILQNVDATVPKGGCTAIVGPNGCGKTTLLLAILKQIPYEGVITIQPPPDSPVPNIGYVPQKLQFDRGLPMTVRDFLVMGVQRMPLWLGTRRRHRENARRLLSYVHSEMLTNRQLGVLSGGELQRILLALALQREPDILILDEPAAGVDVQGGHLFCELLERLRGDKGFTQLMVSHDLATVTHHATHVILLNRRVVAEGPPKDVLTPANLADVFGMHMGLVDARSMPNGQVACTCANHKEKNHA